MNENNSNILIEPIIDSIPHGYITQARKYFLSLRITNINNKPSRVFIISNVVMGSEQGQNIFEDFGQKEFSIPILNPNENIEIKIGEDGQFMYGLVSLKVKIKTENDEVIFFYQKNPFTSRTVKIGDNTWIDFVYIKSANEYSQSVINRRIYLLTVVMAIFTFVQIIPLLKKICGYLVHFFS